MITIYIILKKANGHHMYITVFLDKKDAEEYIFNHPDCYVRHEVR